jgi:nucleobase:cation symporter-1, NCS1 family
VLVADYWLVRKRRLVLGDLYRVDGAYTYSSGWNWRAVVATVCGCALAWIGLVVPQLRALYDYAWFVGFGSAALIHLILMKLV